MIDELLAESLLQGYAVRSDVNLFVCDFEPQIDQVIAKGKTALSRGLCLVLASGT